MIGVRGRANAERTLDDTCTVTRAVAGTWTPEGGLPDEVDTIHDGIPCALHPARGRRRSSAGGDDRARYTHELAVSASVTGIAVGDQVVIASQSPDEPFTVAQLDERSHVVLQRIGLVASRDAEGVPA